MAHDATAPPASRPARNGLPTLTAGTRSGHSGRGQKITGEVLTVERKLEARQDVRAGLEQVREVLVRDARTVLTEGRAGHEISRRQYTVTLTADLGTSAGVRHDVLVELGPPVFEADEARWPLHWEPVTHRRALPVFTGELVARRTPAGTDVILTGTYRPPLGVAGSLGDSVLGRRVARSTAENLLAQIVERIEHQVAHEQGSGGIRPADYPPDLRS
jgi:hypothetical protein